MALGFGAVALSGPQPAPLPPIRKPRAEPSAHAHSSNDDVVWVLEEEEAVQAGGTGGAGAYDAGTHGPRVTAATIGSYWQQGAPPSVGAARPAAARRKAAAGARGATGARGGTGSAAAGVAVMQP